MRPSGEIGVSAELMKNLAQWGTRRQHSRHVDTRAGLLAVALLVWACGDEPVQPLALRYASVSAGYLHSCAVTAAGTAYCWGEDRMGALGDGARDTNRLVPAQVLGGLAFSAVSAGGVDSGHTCAVTTAGAGYCWGNALYGELGDGTSAIGAALVPRAVADSSGLTDVSAGYGDACGLATGGTLWCWGDGTDGELGNGSFFTYSLAPARVGGRIRFVAVSAGGQHVCGIAAGGAGYCWGANDLGALGSGLATSANLPVAVAGGLSFMAISAGRNHTCAIAADSAAYCWGYNAFGRLGNGSDTTSGVPAPVSGGLRFASISSGGYHSCALTSNGSAYCWGRNDSGQLGNGTTTDQWVPTAVGGGLTFKALATGWEHTCGLTTDGIVYCWGLNDHGQLGNGTTVASPVPVRVV
jgi:alpha-tubulin suppressor-like RCC1 family protein